MTRIATVAILASLLLSYGCSTSESTATTSTASPATVASTTTQQPTTTADPSKGTITISVQGWAGVEGYRLLAGVWSGYDIVGGAFWTIIESDPFSETDVVHPPSWDEDPPGVEYESWGEGDYLWDETAALEPGIYRITFWANPRELRPYGSMIPASPIERECYVDVQVTAGEDTEVTISEVLGGGDAECPTKSRGTGS